MKRSLLIAGLLMSVSPAYATCEDYTDGSTTNPAPKVTLCYKGQYDETTLNVVCGSAGTGNYAEYGDGLITVGKPDGSPAIFTNNTGGKMNPRDWTCKEDDDQAGCWINWPPVNK
jgi:hypothetical protein